MVRPYLYDRSGNLISSYEGPLQNSYGLQYGTIMPGGMTNATFNMPWNIGQDKPRLEGNRLIIRDGIKDIWWGTVYDVTDTVSAGGRYINVRGASPWEIAARTPFNQVYPATFAYTANEVAAAATANIADVLMDDDDWVSTGLTITELSLAGNAQSAIVECLRYGDTSTNFWSYIIMPPRRKYPERVPSYITHQSSGSSIADFTSVGGSPISASAPTFRGTTSYGFPAAAGANAYGRHNFPASQAYSYVNAWFYVPTGRPAAEHQYITICQTSGAEIVRLASTSAHVLYAYSTPAAATYDSTVTLGAGCWHNLSLYIIQSAGAGEIEVTLDGKLIIDRAGLNTGANVPYFADIGLKLNGTPARSMFVDNLTIGSYATGAESAGRFYGVMDTRIATETLPYSRLWSLDTSDYDIMISISDIGGDYELTKSLQTVININDVAYSSSSTYVGMASCPSSVAKYGQFTQNQSMTKVSASVVAGYLRNRTLAQYAEPMPVLNSIKLYTSPTSKNGGTFPLSQIRAGLRFRIRELPELGNIYIGTTEYTRGESSQQESCSIAPYGVTSSIDAILALKTQRQWS